MILSVIGVANAQTAQEVDERALLRAMAKAVAELEAARKLIVTLERRRGQLEDALSKASAEAARMRADLATERGIVADLRQALSTAERKMGEMAEEISSLCAQLTALDTKVSDLELANSKLKADIEIVKTERDKARALQAQAEKKKPWIWYLIIAGAAIVGLLIGLAQ